MLQDMKEKFEKEEEKKKAISDELDKVIHDENDLQRILREIENAQVHERDNFTSKFAFLV